MGRRLGRWIVNRLNDARYGNELSPDWNIGNPDDRYSDNYWEENQQINNANDPHRNPSHCFCGDPNCTRR